jgi:hypothetical protein
MSAKRDIHIKDEEGKGQKRARLSQGKSFHTLEPFEIAFVRQGDEASNVTLVTVTGYYKSEHCRMEQFYIDNKFSEIKAGGVGVEGGSDDVEDAFERLHRSIHSEDNIGKTIDNPESDKKIELVYTVNKQVPAIIDTGYEPA